MTEEEVAKLKKDAAKKKKKNQQAGLQTALYRIMKTNKELHQSLKDQAAADTGPGNAGARVLRAVMPVFKSLPENERKDLEGKALAWLDGNIPQSAQIQ